MCTVCNQVASSAPTTLVVFKYTVQTEDILVSLLMCCFTSAPTESLDSVFWTFILDRSLLLVKNSDRLTRLYMRAVRGPIRYLRVDAWSTLFCTRDEKSEMQEDRIQASPSSSRRRG